MQIAGIINISLIKPMRRACKQDQKAQHRDQNEIKPIRRAAFELPQEPRNTRTIPRNQPQRQRQHLSRARTASPRPHARHARTNEIEIDFPVYGGTDKPN